jgi:hypothetical protein
VNPTETKGVRKNKSEEPEIEIELELESGLIVDFIPDFRMQTNISDHSSVQWRLPCTGTPVNMVFLHDELQEEESIYATIFSGSDV